MRHLAWFGIPVLCVSVACGGGSTEPEPFDDEVAMDEAAAVVETGCLTASGDRYVLTALESAGAVTGTPATELYVLLGEEEELRPLVGQEVRVTGATEPAQVAEVVELAPPAEVATGGESQEPQAQVESTSETRLETRELRVATVTPTGGACPAAAQ